MTLNTARESTGRFTHPLPPQRPPLPARKLSMFTDEEDLDKGRVIDVKWKERALLETQRLFEDMIREFASGPETARDPLYTDGLTYSLCLRDRVVRGVVRRVDMVGIHWRYQLELLAMRGVKIQVSQSYMVALRAAPVYYRGYETELPDTDWGAAEYVPQETKDRIAAA